MHKMKFVTPSSLNLSYLAETLVLPDAFPYNIYIPDFMVFWTESLPNRCEPITEWPTALPDTDMTDGNEDTCDIVSTNQDSISTILLSTSSNQIRGQETTLDLIGYNLPCGKPSMVVTAYKNSYDSTCYVNRPQYESGGLVKCHISCTCGDNVCDIIAIKIKSDVGDVIKVCTIHEIEKSTYG